MARKESIPDAIALLKADHRTVEDLFSRYEKAKSEKQKADIVQEICLELSIHAMVEEDFFYPACGEAVEDHLLGEAYVEHDGAKAHIAELLSLDSDEFRDAKVTVLSEMIKHHVKEKEQRDGIFAQVKRSDLDLVELGEQINARKQELKKNFEENEIPLPTTCSMFGDPPIRGSVEAV